MGLLLILLLAIIQGLTEFLPVSSSGHLAAVSMIFNVESSIFMAAFLHLGTLTAIIIAFRQDIKKLLSGILNKDSDSFKYLLYIIVTTFITGILGLLGKSFFEESYKSLNIIAAFWLFTAVIIFLSDYVNEKGRKINFNIAIIIGIVQTLAIFPGISRSGITLVAALILGVSRKNAIKYSFLISIPAIIGANIVEYYDAGIENIPEPLVLISGFFTSAIVGYFSIILLIKLVKKSSLKIFAYYLIPLSILIFMLY